MFSVAYNLYRWSGELDETNTRPARYSASENNSYLDLKMKMIIISISGFSNLGKSDPFLLNFLYINFWKRERSTRKSPLEQARFLKIKN